MPARSLVRMLESNGKMTEHCRRTSSLAFLLLLLLLLLLGFSPHRVSAKDSPDPEEKRGKTAEAATTEVLSLLATRCLECHGEDTAEGGYSIATIGKMTQAGESGKAAVVAGDAEASELFRRLVSRDPDERMPSGGPALSSADIESVRRWIDSGATTGSWGAEQSLAEMAGMGFSVCPAPDDYSRPIPIIGLAVGRTHQRGPDDASDEEPGTSADTARRTETVFVGGYRELLWLPSPASEPRRLAGFDRFIAAIQSRPMEQQMDHPQIAVAHGEPGVRGLVTFVQFGSEAAPTFIHRWSGRDLPGGIAYSPQGDRLAVGWLDGSLSVIDVDSGATTFSSTPHADAILSVAWSADGKQVLTASRDRTARVIRLEDGRAINNYTSHERSVFAVAAMQTGTFTLDQTGKLRLWSGGNKQPRIERQLNRASTVGMVVHGDKLYVAEPQQIIRTRVTFKEVSDGEDDEGKPKTKTVAEWQDENPLTLDAPRTITSLAVAGDGTVWAGTHDGMLYGWQDGKRLEPRHVFPQ